MTAIAAGGSSSAGPLDEQVEDLVQQLERGQLAGLGAGLAGRAAWR